MRDSLPLISILMTAFNRQKYIAEAIDSVRASSYTNWELIIVDDGSTDETVTIAKRFAAGDPRIKLFINETNLGDYPNRNKAAFYASGKYLKYIDSDDYIYPWGLELLVTMMEQFPEAGWGLCSLLQDVKKPFPFELNPAEAYEYHYLGPGLFHKAPLSSVIKKEVFDETGGFSALRMVGDSEMWHRLALKYKVVLMPEGIVWYREHDTQEVNSRSQFDVEYEKIMIRYLRSADCPLNPSVVSFILYKKKQECLQELIKGMLKLKLKQVPKLLKKWKAYGEDSFQQI